MKQCVDKDECEVGSLRLPDHARADDGHHKDVHDDATGTCAIVPLNCKSD